MSGFATRTLRTIRSVVREMLKVTADPEIISFAGGLPAPEFFPVEAIAAATDSILAREGRRALQYSETEGVRPLREAIARRFSTDRTRLHAENVVITHGGQQALDLIGRVFLDQGDRAIVEEPTYLALLSAWRTYGAEFLTVPGDEHGMRTDQLPDRLREFPKLLYVIPSFQNPQGTTLTAERRRALAESCRRHGVGVIEDIAYHELRFEGEALPSLLDLDTELSGVTDESDARNVIQVGTFSKVLAPGLRIGWVIAPKSVADKLVQAKQSTDLHTSTLNQLIACQLLENGTIDREIPRLRQAYRARRDAMLSALSKYAPPGCEWTRPSGGMFLWMRLPSGMDTSAILPHALEEKVAYVPGETFHAGTRIKNTLRLNFSNATPERIEEGIRRLGMVLAGETS